jgi:hypothetical protein
LTLKERDTGPAECPDNAENPVVLYAIFASMKKFIFIFFLLIAAAANAQIEKVKKLVWHNDALQAVVASAKNLHYITFTKDDNSYLEIRPDTSLLNSKRLIYDNSYSTVYLGHTYLFEKQFGPFPAAILLKKLDSLRRNDCYTNYYEGRIFADYIDIKVSSTCPGKSKSDDRVFYKVEDKPGFFGGPAAFQQFVQRSLACTNYKSFIHDDSAFFFYVVIKKDSMSHEVRSIDSLRSPVREVIQNALNNTYGWKPYQKEGRNMSAYLQVFIHIRKDGSIEADYRR